MGDLLMGCAVGAGERDLQFERREPVQAELGGRRRASCGRQCLSCASRPWGGAELLEATQSREYVVARLVGPARVGQP